MNIWIPLQSVGKVKVLRLETPKRKTLHKLFIKIFTIFRFCVQIGFVTIKVEIRINVIPNLNQISGFAVYVEGIVFDLFWNAQNTFGGWGEIESFTLCLPA